MSTTREPKLLRRQRRAKDRMDTAYRDDWTVQRLEGDPTGARMQAPASAGSVSASALIDQRIAELGGWRGPLLARLRHLLLEAVPDAVEEWKWSNPVWSSGGILCTGEAYKAAVKMTFPKGATLPDPAGLFNASLDGKVRRAIDFREGATLNEPALKALFVAAAVANKKG